MSVKEEAATQKFSKLPIVQFLRRQTISFSLYLAVSSHLQLPTNTAMRTSLLISSLPESSSFLAGSSMLLCARDLHNEPPFSGKVVIQFPNLPIIFCVYRNTSKNGTMNNCSWRENHSSIAFFKNNIPSHLGSSV